MALARATPLPAVSNGPWDDPAQGLLVEQDLP
jgi:hypothetical protein